MLFKWELTLTEEKRLKKILWYSTDSILSPILIDSNGVNEFQWNLEILYNNHSSYIQFAIHLIKADQIDTFCAEYKILFSSNDLCVYKNKSLFHVKNRNCHVIDDLPKGFERELLTRLDHDLHDKPVIITFQVEPKFLGKDNSVCPMLQEIPDFEKLFNDSRASDFTIVCGKQEFKVHKIILAARSVVFSAMFELDMKEKNESKAVIDDFTPKVVRELLRYIYCGKVDNLEILSADLLKAANKYLLKGLQVMCLETICNKVLNTDNALQLLSMAVNCKDDIFKSKIINFIVFNLKKISQQPDFKTMMDPSVLQEILTKTVHIWL